MNEIQRLKKLAGLNEDMAINVPEYSEGDLVHPRWAQDGAPYKVVGRTNTGKYIVVDDFGKKGSISGDDIVFAKVSEEITADEIDAAQNDIDLDTGSQYFEDIEKPAQVVSCNQDNTASCRDACAMEEDMDKNVKSEDNQVDLEERAYGLDNGYSEQETLDGQDYFPTGADSPVTSKVGPSGARQGDNPEQKKMEVAETHKELVYNYRKFLKESEQLDELSKDTLKSYAKKRSKDVEYNMQHSDNAKDQSKYAAKVGDPKSAAGWADDAEVLNKRAEKHAGNIAKAVTKVAKKK